jgi:hypothetical protein
VIFALEAFSVTGGQAIGADVMVRFAVIVPTTGVGLRLVITQSGGLKVLQPPRPARGVRSVLAAREAAGRSTPGGGPR